jgi:trehalose utilization protein
MTIEVRKAETDADLEGWIRVKRAVFPNESAWTVQEFRERHEPDRLVLVSWFQGGEVFRSGCCYQRGRGRIFYFRPGHETHPTYHQPLVRRVIANAARWAGMPSGSAPSYSNPPPLEPLG